MFPVKFEYIRVDSVEEAVSLLAEHGEESKILSGGHSLLPLMKMRFAVPEILVDVWHVDALRGIHDDGDYLLIGAATTHHTIVTDDLVRRHCGVLAEVAATIADPQVRHRGTFGGGLAHGDAAGDLPAAALALDAEFVIRGPEGERREPAATFFIDYLETALGDDEVLVAVRVPKLDDTWSWAYEKFVRTAQSWAVVGSCVLLQARDGVVSDARVGLTNMGSVPVRAAVEAALVGTPLVEAASRGTGAGEGTAPPVDQNADATYRRHLASVLTGRALGTAAQRLTPRQEQ